MDRNLTTTERQKGIAMNESAAQLVLSLDHGRLEDVLLSSLIQRLKCHGVSHDEAISLTNQAISEVESIVRETYYRAFDAVARLAFHGMTDPSRLECNVMATFAIAGVEAADRLNKDLTAMRN
jgi:hypothetical protein